MKTEKPKGGAVLTLMAASGTAAEAGDWIAEHLGKTVVELKKPGSDDSILEVYFDSALEAEIAASALAPFGFKHSSVRGYADEEWTESWKKHFKPMDVGRRLRVVPPWLAGSGDRNLEAGGREKRIEVVINPGLSFGTGNHFTTRFCLEQLDRLIPDHGIRTMLDIGTGSGILAIAAAKLGAEKAVGTDLDPVCIECAAENARINGVGARTEFFLHDINEGRPEGIYPIVCANIYSSLLMDHAAALLRLTEKYLLLTGIRAVEADAVADTFADLGAREITRDTDAEWCGLVFEVA